MDFEYIHTVALIGMCFFEQLKLKVSKYVTEKRIHQRKKILEYKRAFHHIHGSKFTCSLVKFAFENILNIYLL